MKYCFSMSMRLLRFARNDNRMALSLRGAEGDEAISAASPRRQELRGIDRRGAFADLEMQLRLTALAAPTRLGDHLTAPDMVAELDGRLVGAAIGRDEVMAVAHQNQIAAAPGPAHMHHDAVIRRQDVGAGRRRKIDALVGRAAGR